MKNPTILIVEDDNILLDALTNKLKNEEFNIIQAKDGNTGLTMALSHKPDLIILDILMPISDGNIFIKKLRENKWGSTVKVLVLTNLNNPEQLEKMKKHNVIDYLIKSDNKLCDISNNIKVTLNIT